MNVTVENLDPCKKLMRVEIDAQKVDETFEAVTKGFRHEANLPGFRPGKAPKEMVLRKYEKDIQEETKRKLISEAYRKAIEEQKLDVLGQPDIEEIPDRFVQMVVKAKDGSLFILDQAVSKSPKTAEMVKKLQTLGLSSALIVGGKELDANFVRAARNIPLIDVLPVQGCNVYDILRRDTLVLTREAVADLEARLA